MTSAMRVLRDGHDFQGLPVTKLPPVASQRRLAEPGLLDLWHPSETRATAVSLLLAPGISFGRQGRQQIACDKGTRPPPFSCKVQENFGCQFVEVDLGKQ